MIQLDNQTPWSAGLYPGWSRAGARQFTLVVKAGFAFDGQGRLAPLSQPAIEEADRYYGEPGKSSLAAACETVPFKQGSEVLLTGMAHPPTTGRTVCEVAIDLRRDDQQVWSKTLRVFGRRRWQSKLLMLVPGTPDMSESVPLRYENAYGGCDPTDPEKVFPTNPVGKGFADKGQRLKDVELPQVEIGPKFISAPGMQPQPAGFGPLSPLWEPRLSAFAKLDENAALNGGCPWGERAPGDLFNAAPLDQRFAAPFVGDELVTLRGLIPEAPQGVPIHLPRVQPDLFLKNAGCDTLVGDGDHQRLFLLFRAALPWNARQTQTGWVLVRVPSFLTPRA
jgi:hypothetical protein